MSEQLEPRKLQKGAPKKPCARCKAILSAATVTCGNCGHIRPRAAKASDYAVTEETTQSKPLQPAPKRRKAPAKGREAAAVGNEPLEQPGGADECLEDAAGV